MVARTHAIFMLTCQESSPSRRFHIINLVITKQFLIIGWCKCLSPNALLYNWGPHVGYTNYEPMMVQSISKYGKSCSTIGGCTCKPDLLFSPNGGVSHPCSMGNVVSPLLNVTNRGMDGEYVDDDVEDRSSGGVCVQPDVRTFVNAGYSSFLMLYLLRSDWRWLIVNPENWQ